jgi:anhydro-N-acetylmuramic acid kinase
MNQSLTKLANLSQKEHRTILGLMSGTSLDGLDIALCKISGFGLGCKVEVEQFETLAYSDEFKQDLRSVFAKKQVDLEKLTLLNASIGSLHAELINQFIEQYSINPEEIDCIASHGQTIYHAPKRLHGMDNYPNATLQIGDADHIAVKTGIAVLSDFRQKHVAAGGEGAPLALYGDCILFSSEVENRVLLNIGGISNFTYLPKGGQDQKIICTDAGPGNTMIDALCKKYFNVGYDKNGELGRQGKLNEALLAKMLEHPFFKEDLPKSTGPELFNLQFIENALQGLAGDITTEDLVHTATMLTAKAIVLGIKKATEDADYNLFVSGGGAHNSFLIDTISSLLPGIKISQMEELGVSADAKEAVLFSILANETLCGSAINTGAGPQIMMGKISLPD